jgi:hypothetical protein
MAQGRGKARRWLGCAAPACVALLTGCADGVDLNGKVFDWMGVSPAAQEARKFEPKLAERAPLVMPPDVNRLPEPGSEKAPGQMVWPDDADERKVREAKERERLHLAYCRGEIQWKERALNKDASAPRSPYGPCPGLFSGTLTNNISKQ